nr:MAG TPA: CRISPR-associated protein [Caudoviricetes sp.]
MPDFPSVVVKERCFVAGRKTSIAGGRKTLRSCNGRSS